jgi:hypothetical protein
VLDRVKAWLREEVDHREDNLDEYRKVPRKERICWLLAWNGGSWKVGGYGVIGWGGTFRQGLHMEEAHELMHYASTMFGLSFVVEDIDPCALVGFGEWIAAAKRRAEAPDRFCETLPSEGCVGTDPRDDRIDFT